VGYLIVIQKHIKSLSRNFALLYKKHVTQKTHRNKQTHEYKHQHLNKRRKQKRIIQPIQKLYRVTVVLPAFK